MRRANRVDANHRAIVKALEAVGATVQPLTAAGGGCPDLLVGYRGCTYLLEVKSPPGPRGGKSADGQHLNAMQRQWVARWTGGQVVVVRTPDEALKTIWAVTH